MSKELEALERIGDTNVTYYRNGLECSYFIEDTDDFDIIKDGLSRLEKYDALNLSCEEMQYIANIIKNPEHQLDKLKAFEIIKETQVNVFTVIHSKNYEDFRKKYFDINCLYLKFPTQEEYDLLKEMLYSNNTDGDMINNTFGLD